jgi:hypothetical protein
VANISGSVPTHIRALLARSQQELAITTVGTGRSGQDAVNSVSAVLDDVLRGLTNEKESGVGMQSVVATLEAAVTMLSGLRHRRVRCTRRVLLESLNQLRGYEVSQPLTDRNLKALLP